MVVVVAVAHAVATISVWSRQKVEQHLVSANRLADLGASDNLWSLRPCEAGNDVTVTCDLLASRH